MSSVRKQMALRNEQDQQLRDHIITARKEVSYYITRFVEITLDFSLYVPHRHNV